MKLNPQIATKPQICPAALIQTIKVNLLRRPLWQLHTVSDCLDLSREQVMAKIQDGTFPFAFDIGNGPKRKLTRILALSVVEQQLGPIPGVGKTRNLSLPAVVDLILPKRDIRSTELKRLMSCGNDWLGEMKSHFAILQEAKPIGGPNSYCVLSRESVAKWLSERRIT